MRAAVARRVKDPRWGRVLLATRTLDVEAAIVAARALDDVADNARLEVVEAGQRYVITPSTWSPQHPGFRRTSARNASPGFLLRETYVVGDRVRLSTDEMRWRHAAHCREVGGMLGMVMVSPHAPAPRFAGVLLTNGVRWTVEADVLDMEPAS